MDLILIGGIAGAISGLLGYFVAKAFVNRQERPQVHLAILVLCVVGGSQIASAVITPLVRSWRAERQLDAILDADPLFLGIIADHPELRAPLVEQFKDAMVKSDRGIAAIAGNMILGPVLPEYIAKAPDAEVRGFGEAQLKVLKALQPDGDRCFRWANPAVDGPAVPTADEGRDEAYTALRALVVGARENPVEVVEDGEALLGDLSRRVYETYGEQMTMLAAPTSPDVDRNVYCEILIAVYEEVLALPERESASVMRFMMAAE